MREERRSGGDCARRSEWQNIQFDAEAAQAQTGRLGLSRPTRHRLACARSDPSRPDPVQPIL